MDVVFPHCAGLDVHKKRITACRVSPDPTDQEADGVMDVQDFGTFTIEWSCCRFALSPYVRHAADGFRRRASWGFVAIFI
jgi:hypothetical protein